MQAAHAIGIWIFAAVLVGAAGQQESGQQSRARLGAARTALGDASEIAAVKTMSLTGTLRVRNQLFGTTPDAREEFVSIHFDTKILLPDHYLEALDTGVGVRLSGFAGSRPLNRAVLPDGRVVADTYPADMIDAEYARVGYLVLALLLRTDTVFPFAFRGASGDTLTFKGGNGVEVLVDLDPGTALPARLRFDANVRSASGLAKGVTIATTVELSDYRTVGRLRLPHHHVTSRKGVLQSDRQFELIELNSPLMSDDFRK